MATIEKELARAEFWDGHVCLACGHTEEEWENVPVCPECGVEAFVEAKHVRAFLARVDQEREQG